MLGQRGEIRTQAETNYSRVLLHYDVHDASDANTVSEQIEVHSFAEVTESVYEKTVPGGEINSLISDLRNAFPNPQLGTKIFLERPDGATIESVTIAYNPLPGT